MSLFFVGGKCRFGIGRCFRGGDERDVLGVRLGRDLGEG